MTHYISRQLELQERKWKKQKSRQAEEKRIPAVGPVGTNSEGSRNPAANPRKKAISSKHAVLSGMSNRRHYLNRSHHHRSRSHYHRSRRIHRRGGHHHHGGRSQNPERLRTRSDEIDDVGGEAHTIRRRPGLNGREPGKQKNCRHCINSFHFKNLSLSSALRANTFRSNRKRSFPHFRQDGSQQFLTEKKSGVPARRLFRATPRLKFFAFLIPCRAVSCRFSHDDGPAECVHFVIQPTIDSSLKDTIYPLKAKELFQEQCSEPIAKGAVQK